MKKVQILGFLALLSLGIFYPNRSFAVSLDPLDGTPYVTSNVRVDLVNDPFPHFVVLDDGPGTIFDWDIAPYFRLTYTLSGINDFDVHNDILNAHWTHPNGSQFDWQSVGSCVGCTGETSTWGTIPDWSINRAPGNWSVDLTYNMDGGDPEFFQTLPFTIKAPVVTPEPVSLVLFPLGGALLAFSRRRFSKK